MNDQLNLPVEHKALRTCIESLLEFWPDHRAFVRRSLAVRDSRELEHCEHIAQHIMKISDGNLSDYVSGYKTMCDMVLEEEIFFRRNNRYRATSYEEVNAAVYAARDLMSAYMHGLLFSQVVWSNHVGVSVFFEDYLSSLPKNFEHLEVGPGHGLFLYRCGVDPKCKSAIGWDVSDASIALTRSVLAKLECPPKARVAKGNIFDQTSERYDSIVCSEVLEHLENPLEASRALVKLLKPGGLAFINAPCNSPAPDHLTLFRQPEDLLDLLKEAGFEIVQQRIIPASGLTLEKARKASMAISCAAICRAA